MEYENNRFEYRDRELERSEVRIYYLAFTSECLDAHRLQYGLSVRSVQIWYSNLAGRSEHINSISDGTPDKSNIRRAPRVIGKKADTRKLH